ncbi:MAG: polysaccharide deacetylase family protein [Granulosicoccus sp.]
MSDSENSPTVRLTKALDDRAVSGHPVSFWLRDDDAIAPCESLDALLKLTASFSVPLTLAVIPAHTGLALAQRLDACSGVSVAVHGWSHTNYAGADEKKQELGNHRALNEVTAELQRGFRRLSEWHPSRFVPLLVPPWNRIASDVANQIGALGFKGLSTFGEEKPGCPRSVNTQVDIIDWKGTRGGRPANELADEVTMQVQNGRSAIGILTHQLVHDEAAWHFLRQLFEVSSAHAGARWVSVSELMK